MSYPLLNFNTETFIFKIYTNTEEENKMLEEFQNDEKTKEFLPDFLKYIEETKKDLEEGFEPLRYTTIVYLNNYPIGLTTFYDSGNELVYSLGIRPSERGKSLGSKIKKEAYNYAFENIENIEKIVGYIDIQNISSLKSVEKTTSDNIEKIYDPIKNKEFYKFSTNNPYFKKENKSL